MAKKLLTANDVRTLQNSATPSTYTERVKAHITYIKKCVQARLHSIYLDKSKKHLTFNFTFPLDEGMKPEEILYLEEVQKLKLHYECRGFMVSLRTNQPYGVTHVTSGKNLKLEIRWREEYEPDSE